VTTYLIFGIRQLVEKNWEYGKELELIFTDYKKASDCVREEIWKSGHIRNFNIYFRKVKNTYEKTRNCVKTNKGWSSRFETRSEVRQGSILSPVLFNVIMNKICNKIKEKIKETFKRFYIRMTWSEDVKDLETRLNLWERISKEYRLEINIQKTVILKLTRNGREKINLKQIKEVDKSVYFGSVVKKNCKIQNKINGRIGNASKCYH
jgi:hypothetical protein